MMQDQAINGQEQAIGTESGKTPLPLRSDTILGVCEALGEDFGFNPLWLRVALAAGLLWNPAAIVGGYLAVGLLIAVSRFVFPPVTVIAAAAEEPARPAAQPAAAEAQNEDEKELIAA